MKSVIKRRYKIFEYLTFKKYILKDLNGSQSTECFTFGKEQLYYTSKLILTMVNVLRLNGDQTNRVLQNNKLSREFC